MFLASAFVLLWLAVSAWLVAKGCEALDGRFGRWVELANGATWPSGWPELCSVDSGTFMLALAARTLLNFAGPLLVVLSGIWLLTGGLERFVAMTQEQQLRQLSSQLVAELYTVVRSRRGDASDDVMRDEVQEMHAVAAEVVDEYLQQLGVAERPLRRPLMRS